MRRRALLFIMAALLLPLGKAPGTAALLTARSEIVSTVSAAAQFPTTQSAGATTTACAATPAEGEAVPVEGEAVAAECPAPLQEGGALPTEGQTVPTENEAPPPPDGTQS